MRRSPEETAGPLDNRGGIYPPGPADTVGEADLRALFRTVWRRKGVIFGTAALLTGLAAAVVFQLTPRYTAKAVLMIESRQSKVVDLDAVVEGLPADRETTAGETEVLRSRGLAAQVIGRLGLSRDPEFNPALRPPSFLEAALDSIGIAAEEWTAGPPRARGGEGSSAQAGRERDRVRVIDAFLENLKVSSKRDTRVITVKFDSESPRRAAQTANAVAERYIAAQLEAKFEATRRASAWLNGRVAALRGSVRDAERAVEEYRRASGLLEGKGVTIASQQVSELNTQLILAGARRAEAVARLVPLGSTQRSNRMQERRF